LHGLATIPGEKCGLGIAALLLALSAALPACHTLPDPYLDPEGQETIHSVIESAPGQWHVLVRVNYFSSEEAAERLLRERVADLCPEGDLVVDNLHVAGVPRVATADVHCAGAEAPAATLGTEDGAVLPDAP
jgi:hypothetical protein